MRYMLILLVAALAALPAFAAIDLARETSAHGGILALRGSQLWLQEATCEELRLLLAPAAQLDSLGLSFASGDTLFVEGIRDQGLLLVEKLRQGQNPEWLGLRDFSQGSFATGGSASYRVSPQTCIGCRLCLAPCPTGAITFSRGKAQIDPAKCTECGICVEGNGKFRGCPVGAISGD